MNRLTFVNGDDWQGLYLNGILMYEGHSIPSYAYGDIINETVGGIQEYIALEVDYDWMTHNGVLPGYLSDIPDEVML